MRLGISIPLVGVVYLVALAMQLSMNIELVASDRAGTRIDLLGFVAMMSTGLVLAINEFGRGTLRARPTLYFVAFGLYIAMVIAFTSDSQLIAVFLSKYGILTWALGGSFAALAINAISRRLLRSPGGFGLWRLLVHSLPATMLCIVLFPLRGYMANPVPIESYQFAAANATVLCIVVLIAAAQWAPAKAGLAFLIEGVILLGLGTIVAYLVSRMDSMSIVLVWTILAVLYVRTSGAKLPARNAILFVSILMAGAVGSLGTGAFADLVENTRFRELAQGNLNISSLASRLDLLPTFWSQFRISPLVGHFEAEVMAGYLPGEYVHSLPLSLLTHAGVIGTLIFAAATFSTIRTSVADSDAQGLRRPERALVRHIFLGILSVAAMTTFFLWIPFWFMVGFLLLRHRSYDTAPVWSWEGSTLNPATRAARSCTESALISPRKFTRSGIENDPYR